MNASNGGAEFRRPYDLSRVVKGLGVMDKNNPEKKYLAINAPLSVLRYLGLAPTELIPNNEGEMAGVVIKLLSEIGVK